MARVRLEDLAKTYRRSAVPALEHFSLEVPQGELLAIVGPSGSGKSTVLRSIAGLARPDAGRIYFDERDVTGVPAERRGAAMVFQHHALYAHLSVRENIAFGLRARRVERRAREARTLAAARSMRVEAFLARRPRELSGGEAQRVALARALAIDPAIVLLDEPLSNLDAQLRTELRLELNRVQRATGATTIFVTHDQSEAMALGHRIAVMREGKLEQIGTPRDLYDRPASAFVAQFVGTPAMALVRGSVDDAMFHAAGGGLSVPAPGVRSGDVLLGLRAGAVTLDPAGVTRGTVRDVEDLGEDVFVFVDGSFGALVARAPRGLPPPVPGDNVALAIAAGRTHFFEAESGARREPHV